MSHNMTHGVRGLLGRIGWRVRAVVAECNYTQTQLTSWRSTPGAYQTPGKSA
jgi:hypothetical protein